MLRLGMVLLSFEVGEVTLVTFVHKVVICLLRRKKIAITYDDCFPNSYYLRVFQDQTNRWVTVGHVIFVHRHV